MNRFFFAFLCANTANANSQPHQVLGGGACMNTNNNIKGLYFLKFVLNGLYGTIIFTKVHYYSFPGDIFLVPNKTFLVMGGVKVFSLQSVTFQLGTRTMLAIVH